MYSGILLDTMKHVVCAFVPFYTSKIEGYRKQPHSHAGLYITQKLETQNQKEDQISIRTTPDNAEAEVFSDSRRFFHDFF